jgi:hypothetical protein
MVNARAELFELDGQTAVELHPLPVRRNVVVLEPLKFGTTAAVVPTGRWLDLLGCLFTPTGLPLFALVRGCWPEVVQQI